MSELGETLASLRKRAGLSQSELASRSNLTGGYISQLESGTRGDRVPRITLERLAQALGVDPRILKSAAGLRVNAGHVDIQPRPPLEDFIETEPSLSRAEKSMLLSLIGYFRNRPDNPNEGEAANG